MLPRRRRRPRAASSILPRTFRRRFRRRQRSATSCRSTSRRSRCWAPCCAIRTWPVPRIIARPPPIGSMHLGLATAPENIVLANGAQGALAAVLSALARPGDTILTESALLQRSAQPRRPARSASGAGRRWTRRAILPDALAAVVRQRGAKILILSPTIQNPTAALMPQARREALAEVARSLDLLLIEDDVYGPLVPDRPSALATLAPERTLYLGSVSKFLAPGLRLGFAAGPPSVDARGRGRAARALPRPAAILRRDLHPRPARGRRRRGAAPAAARDERAPGARRIAPRRSRPAQPAHRSPCLGAAAAALDRGRGGAGAGPDRRPGDTRGALLHRSRRGPGGDPDLDLGASHPCASARRPRADREGAGERRRQRRRDWCSRECGVRVAAEKAERDRLAAGGRWPGPAAPAWKRTATRSAGMPWATRYCVVTPTRSRVSSQASTRSPLRSAARAIRPSTATCQAPSGGRAAISRRNRGRCGRETATHHRIEVTDAVAEIADRLGARDPARPDGVRHGRGTAAMLRARASPRRAPGPARSPAPSPAPPVPGNHQSAPTSSSTRRRSINDQRSQGPASTASACRPRASGLPLAGEAGGVVAHPLLRIAQRLVGLEQQPEGLPFALGSAAVGMQILGAQPEGGLDVLGRGRPVDAEGPIVATRIPTAAMPRSPS